MRTFLGAGYAGILLWVVLWVVFFIYLINLIGGGGGRTPGRGVKAAGA